MNIIKRIFKKIFTKNKNIIKNKLKECKFKSIYNGSKYIAFGEVSSTIYSTNNYSYRIEKIYRPFNFIGITFPIIIKSKINKRTLNPMQYYDIYTIPLYEFLSNFCTIKITWFNCIGDKIEDINNNNDKNIIKAINCYSLQDGSIIGSPEETFNYIVNFGLTEFHSIDKKIDENDIYSSYGFDKINGRFMPLTLYTKFFEIGQKTKKGDMEYKFNDKSEYISYLVEYYGIDNDYQIKTKNFKLILSGYSTHKIKMVEIEIDENGYRKENNGEWEAKTIEDAKRMTIDFVENFRKFEF